MAKPTKRKVPGGSAVTSGRVTPKGGAIPRASAGRPSGTGSASGRYTPPTSSAKRSRACSDHSSPLCIP